MAQKVSHRKVNVKEIMISIGIDVHKASWRLTAVRSGEVILALTISQPTYSKLKKVLDRLEGNTVRIVYKADLYNHFVKHACH